MSNDSQQKGEVALEQTSGTGRRTSDKLAELLAKLSLHPAPTSLQSSAAKTEMDAFLAKIDSRYPDVASKAEAAQLFGRKPNISKRTEDAINAEVEKFDAQDEKLKKALIEGRDFYAQQRPFSSSNR